MEHPDTGARADFAVVDIDRERRQGLPEVVYAPGKDLHEITAIVGELTANCSGPVLVTRIEADAAAAVLADVPDGHYHRRARLLTWRPAARRRCRVCVVTAGTADGRVAEEALQVCLAVGLDAHLVADVGVAGIHRVLNRVDELRAADIVIVVAGMEGALASVVGGLVGCPVVAVPTSTGYGAALNGMTALAGMLTSCASGMSVVNIDSGFGAAMAAHRLAYAIEARG
ncbi:1-(5-phosphoribosyl)-5-amino-4-imidazole-carboxyl ate carboxylase [Mycolicibacterium litorale]|uniref:1-(5-phosphoribosyl)-5-amino-4-imidazole-carboxyl ate carboxylase n=1 Tax=Mycolicibacterium litorale TaxID=758802 RepID=A0A6S6NYD1_9MYCO|nr:nickel pincer cofactor biosynthesis protein LarB [Mycolicibacterium litorale]BCI51035.1 1-(5-phosphoribosyl)-5-amino-4-imidazole-carboxyl ate carboxylase [Mycolicibacterium litorale]